MTTRAATQIFLAATLVALALRIAGLALAAPELGPDETQYWFWSRTPAAGYYSKPPLIAWAIAFTTGLFGDAEWAARLAAPVFHAGAAAFLFMTAARLYGPRAGLAAGLAWLVLPGVTLSSALITTDAPLLFFWSAALWCVVALSSAHGRGAFALAAALGACIGLGMLSKYAMIYFPLGLAAGAIASPFVRSALSPARAVVAAATALAVMAPNLLWNAANDFQTVAHTAANANWGGSLFHPMEMLDFLFGQLGVAGPTMLALMALAGAKAVRARDPRGLGLLALALPPLVIVTAQALLSRAHANWAAAAYPALVVLAAGAAEPRLFRRWFDGTTLAHAALAAGFIVVLASAPLADALGLSGAFKRLRGWETQGAIVAETANREGVDAVMADDREVMGGLVYYARDFATDGGRFVALDPNGRIDHHYEAFHALDPARDRRVLYVTTRANPDAAGARFNRVEAAGTAVADLGGGRTRTLYLFVLSEPRVDS